MIPPGTIDLGSELRQVLEQIEVHCRDQRTELSSLTIGDLVNAVVSILTLPHYGERMISEVATAMETETLAAVLKHLSHALHQRFNGSTRDDATPGERRIVH